MITPIVKTAASLCPNTAFDTACMGQRYAMGGLKARAWNVVFWTSERPVFSPRFSNSRYAEIL